MAYVQKLYTQLREIAFQDPIFRAIANGTLSWADASSTVEEEWRYNDYITNGEGGSILASVKKEMDRINGRAAKKGVQFEMDESSDEEEVIEKTRPSTLLFNPNNIKTIITRNLPRDITMDELRFIFEKYGVVRDIYIPKNQDKQSPYFGTIKGFALIKFLNSDESTNAYVGETAKLNIRGKLITVEFAKSDRE
jgi:RNA recognition motif-containing protein